MKTIKSICLLFCAIFLTSCANPSNGEPAGTVEPVKKNNQVQQNVDSIMNNSNEMADIERIAKLQNLSIDMENQLPQIKYNEMDGRLLEFYTQPLQEEYEFYGRFSNLGYAYIIGICKEKTASLNNLQLGPNRSEFPMIDLNQNYIQLGNWSGEQQFEPIYQFQGIHSFFMSSDGKEIYLGVNQPEDADLGIIFDRIVNENEKEYFEQLNTVKAKALPPVDGAFIQVRRLWHGKYYCEYVSISQEKFDEIINDRSKVESGKIDKTAIELYTSIHTWREGETRLNYINQLMFEEAKNQSLMKVLALSELKDIKKIEINRAGNNSGSKVIEDINIVSKIEEILDNSHTTEMGGCPYVDLLILTKMDGSKIELQLAADSCDGFILGSYTCFTPGKENWKVLKKYIE